jgi:hypothetical protein
VARLSVPATVPEGSTVALDGGASSDADGDALDFAWTLSDGGTATGSPASHVVTQDGPLTVTLTVRDRYGVTSAATGTIAVENVVPQVGPIAGATILVGERYAAAGGFADPGADPWTATVDYGDGAGAVPLALAGQRFALAHDYRRAGTFTVAVTVRDDDAAGTAGAQVVVLTAAEGAASLADAVRALADGGSLPRGAANSLLAKLQAATAQLERGRGATAAQQLAAFGHEVEALVRSGRLAEAQGATLTALAERVARSATAG